MMALFLMSLRTTHVPGLSFLTCFPSEEYTSVVGMTAS